MVDVAGVGLGATLEQGALRLCLNEPVKESCGGGCVVVGFVAWEGVGEIMAANGLAEEARALECFGFWTWHSRSSAKAAGVFWRCVWTSEPRLA